MKPGSISFYAECYAANERTVKRWKATGREKDDVTPLGNPEAMLAWWSRNMHQRVPDGITAAVIRFRRENKSTSPLPAPIMELPSQVPAMLADDKLAERRLILDRPIDPEEIGTEQTLQRLLEMEVRLSRLATDPGQAKPWQDTVARIGPMAEKLRRENEISRKLIPRAEAESAIQSYHVPLKNEIYLLPGTLFQLFGLPFTPEMDERARGECDRLLHRLNETVLIP